MPGTKVPGITTLKVDEEVTASKTNLRLAQDTAASLIPNIIPISINFAPLYF